MSSAVSTTPGRSPLPRWAVPVAAVAAFLLLVAWIASIGGPLDPLEGVSAVLYGVIRAGTPAAVYLGAAIGLGSLLSPFFAGARERFALQATLGLSLLLTLSHLLGWLSVFGTAIGMPVAAGVCGIGLILLARQVVRAFPARGAVHLSPVWAAALPALALLLVAACTPPGWLWASEGHGYDALEYHLQLPQEWLANGQIRPLAHNVYSYLPSYIESAFLHIAAMTAGPRSGTASSPAMGLLAGDGMGILSCQFLHAGIAVLSAVVLSRLVAAAVRMRSPEIADGHAAAGAVAGSVFLSVPWTIVTGSLPYNDLGVVLLLAGAMIAALEASVSPARRGLIVGVLIGAACGVKPTALLLGAPPVAVLLIGTMPPKHWGVALLAAAGAGAAMLAPWLIRNAIASGNPVFPAATSVFGMGRWSAEQVARFDASHRFDGSVLDRLRLAMLPDPRDPMASPDHPVHRGLMHAQWSFFFPLVAASIAVLLASSRRRIATLLSLALASQLLAWLFATHIQSRFAIPMAVPGAALVGLAVATVAERGAVWSRIATGVGIAAALGFAAHSTAIFASQGQAADGETHPNALLMGGPQTLTGGDLRQPLSHVGSDDQRRILEQQGPVSFANLVLPRGSKLYLLGDSTPLYFTVPVIYTTTYDRSLLADAISRHPDDPAAWAESLRRAGVTHVMANLAELTRLERSHFLDPDLKPEAIRRFLSEQATAVRVWPELGTGLYQLGAPPK